MAPEKSEKKKLKERRKLQQQEIKKRLKQDSFYTSARLTKWLSFFLIFGLLLSYVMYESKRRDSWILDEEIVNYNGNNVSEVFQESQTPDGTTPNPESNTYPLIVTHRFDLDETIQGFEFPNLHQIQYLNTETTPTLLLLSDRHLMTIRDEVIQVSDLDSETHVWQGNLETFKSDNKWYWSALDQQSRSICIGNLEGEIVWKHQMPEQLQITETTTFFAQPTESGTVLLVADFDNAVIHAAEPFVGTKWTASYPDYAEHISYFKPDDTLKLQALSLHLDRESLVFSQNRIKMDSTLQIDPKLPHYYLIDRAAPGSNNAHIMYMAVDVETGELNGLLKNQTTSDDAVNRFTNRFSDQHLIQSMVATQKTSNSRQYLNMPGITDVIYFREENSASTDDLIESSIPLGVVKYSNEMSIDVMRKESRNPNATNSMQLEDFSRKIQSTELLNLETNRYGNSSQFVVAEARVFSLANSYGNRFPYLIFVPSMTYQTSNLFSYENYRIRFKTMFMTSDYTLLIPENNSLIYSPKGVISLSDLFGMPVDHLKREDIGFYVFGSSESGNKFIAFSAKGKLLVMKYAGVDDE